MLQLQLAPQHSAVWRLPLAALAVNMRRPVHNGKHALQRTLCLGNVWEAQLQAAAAEQQRIAHAYEESLECCAWVIHTVCLEASPI